MFSELNEWNVIFLIVHLYVKQLLGVSKIELRPLSLCTVALPLPVSIGKVLYFLFTMLKRYVIDLRIVGLGS